MLGVGVNNLTNPNPAGFITASGVEVMGICTRIVRTAFVGWVQQKASWILAYRVYRRERNTSDHCYDTDWMES